MIRALRHLGPMCYLVFSGSGPESSSHREIMELAGQCGILRRVVCLEQLPHFELLNYYGACDVGLLLYANDGIGNYCQCPGRFSEYLLCGLPMVSSKSPSLELLTLKHAVGATCDGNDPESIAKAVRGLVELPIGARKEMRLRIARCGKSEWVYDDDASILERRIDELP